MSARGTKVVAALVAVVVMGSMVVACGSDDADQTATTGSTASSTTSGTGSTTTTATPTTTTTAAAPPSGAADGTAVWPTVAGTPASTDPVEAARAFAVDFLGFVDPVAGAFQQGDSRSGEVGIEPSGGGPVTTVFVRQLGPDDAWSVLGTSTPNLQIASPDWDAAITSPVAVSGQSTAFEATVNVEVRQDGSATPLASDIVMGGSMGEMGPFAGSIAFTAPSADAGAIVLKTLSAKDGTIWEATVLRVRFS